MANDDRRIESLIDDLDHLDKPTLRAAVDKLIALATDSEDVRASLNRRLSELGHRNYWPVAYILGHQPQPPGAAIRNLLDVLDHREPDIRWAIALLLIRIAKGEGSVIHLLIELCKTGTANQKRMAIYCLRDLQLSDGESLQALTNSLADSDFSVRVAAVTSLKTRSDIDEGVRDALLRVYLNDAEIKVRNAAAVTLASFGSPSDEFLRALRDSSKSENGQTKKAAEAALALLKY